MQLLFEGSDEERTACLGLIPGRVRALEPAPGRPVPHMGWSRVDVRDAGHWASQTATIFISRIASRAMTAPRPSRPTNYGREIAAAVRHENWLGAQFHPERSGEPAARFLESFLA